MVQGIDWGGGAQGGACKYLGIGTPSSDLWRRRSAVPALLPMSEIGE